MYMSGGGGGKINESSLALCTDAPCFCFDHLYRHEKSVEMCLEPQLLMF